ncbi:MAG: DUF503 domain-containing protein [Nitrospirae bacterium]|nr:MAG: DUF503 domain-containing protein [Nitrospirota bacterium]
MIVGLLTVELFLPESNSLKTKRFAIRSIKDKLKKFNVSVGEHPNNLWQKTTLTIACVSTDTSHLHSTFESVKNTILSNGSVELIRADFEIL